MKKQTQDAPEKVYDFSFLKNLGNHDDAFIQNLQEVFIKTIPSTADEMVNACEQQNWQAAGKLAHKLKASSDMFNIIAAKDKIRFIEQHAASLSKLDVVMAKAVEVKNTLHLAAEQMQQNL